MNHYPSNNNNKKAVVKNADMAEDMQEDILRLSKQAIEKHDQEKDIASLLKKQCDEKFGPTWHCVVGKHFGSYVTHETKHFIYLYIGAMAILLFKSG